MRSLVIGRELDQIAVRVMDIEGAHAALGTGPGHELGHRRHTFCQQMPGHGIQVGDDQAQVGRAWLRSQGPGLDGGRRLVQIDRVVRKSQGRPAVAGRLTPHAEHARIEGRRPFEGSHGQDEMIEADDAQG